MKEFIKAFATAYFEWGWLVMLFVAALAGFNWDDASKYGKWATIVIVIVSPLVLLICKHCL